MLMRIRTVTAITPVLNGAPLIARTVESLTNQSAVRSGRLNLTYLLCAGASMDATAEAADRILWRAPDRLEKFANPHSMLSYESESGEWR
jgi:hypothetical protein